jgi:hypothetical protein
VATLEEEQLNANLDILLQIRLADIDDPVQRREFEKSIDGIRAEYKEAAEKGKTSKYHKEVAESIANCVPELLKGALAAAAAFENGDFISGSAALLDMCTSLIPVFTSVLSAAGPYGAIAGAIFSVVGQILSLFMPKQPSLKDEIKKMLDHLQSEKQIQDITAFGHSVSSYTNSLTKICRGDHRMTQPLSLAGTVSLTPGSKSITGTGTAFTRSTGVGEWLMFDSDTSIKVYKIEEIVSDTGLTLATAYAGAPAAASTLKQSRRTTVKRSIAEILEMPLETNAQATDFRVEMTGLQLGLMAGQAKLNVPVFANWQVAGYLEREENQGKDGWPEVLGVWCRAYTDLLSANMMLNCLADPKTLDRRLAETQAALMLAQETNEQGRLAKETREACHTALINLKALAGQLRESWESDNKEMLKIVRAITPAAKERGIYAHLGSWQGSYVLYVARGTGSAVSLPWDYKKNTAWLRSISIYTSKAQKDSFVPKYELLTSNDYTHGYEIWRHTLDSVTGELSAGTLVVRPRASANEEFVDVSAGVYNEGSIGYDESTHPVSLAVIAIRRKDGKWDYINQYTIDKNLASTRVNWEPPLAGVKDIRSLYLPPTTLPDDPDADAMKDSAAKPPGPILLSQKSPVMYGGIRDANQLYVVAWNAWAKVNGPEKWTSYNGIEIDPYYVWVFGKNGIACATHASMIKCRQGKTSRPSWILHDFDTKEFVTPPEVISLSPCVDGTLLVAIPGEIYTADYKIDRSKNRVLTSSWVRRGGNAKQVIKMPIPCWEALESLRENLQSE